MYREDSWEEGHYIDNHEKHQCADCGKQFILGKRMVEELFPFAPQCPYCGSKNVELVSWTEDEQLEELSDSMGCLAISVDLGTECHKVEVELRNRWIPCSESMPEDGVEVFLTFENDSGRQVDTAWCKEGDFYFVADTIGCMVEEKYTNPIAWMPLPEPYKGGE